MVLNLVSRGGPWKNRRISLNAKKRCSHTHTHLESEALCDLKSCLEILIAIQ